MTRFPGIFRIAENGCRSALLFLNFKREDWITVGLGEFFLDFILNRRQKPSHLPSVGIYFWQWLGITTGEGDEIIRTDESTPDADIEQLWTKSRDNFKLRGLSSFNYLQWLVQLETSWPAKTPAMASSWKYMNHGINDEAIRETK